MGKATKLKKDKVGTAGHVGNVHPLIAQADIPAMQAARRAYEVVEVANPHGEVMVRGAVRPHKAVRIKPAFREMYERRTFDRAVIDGCAQPAVLIMAALEWYDARLDLANSGMVKCGLAVSGGGSGGMGIPSLAAMEARAEVAWVRRVVPCRWWAAFDAVMVDGDSFTAAAQRLHRRHYAGRSVERARAIIAKEFVAAASVFARAWAARFVRQASGWVEAA